MQYRRSMMIVLAIGLALFEFGLFNFPEDANVPGGIVAWMFMLAAFWLVIPIAFLIALVAAMFMPPDKGESSELIPDFTIRDLLWLTILAAVACAWWVDHHSQPPQTVQAMQKAANDAGYAFMRSEDGFNLVRTNRKPASK
jgi:hypothetical protein